jgi:hypothetical protein
VVRVVRVVRVRVLRVSRGKGSGNRAFFEVVRVVVRVQLKWCGVQVNLSQG